MSTKHEKAIIDIETIIKKKQENYLEQICQYLDRHFEHFNWTGFYFMNHEREVLEIGPYVGAPTDHLEIPFGKGICGQVAKSGKTFISQDVYSEDNYLACSTETQAEIVVPIFNQQNVLIGQLDIDSHFKNSITPEDQKTLFAICEMLSEPLS